MGEDRCVEDRTCLRGTMWLGNRHPAGYAMVVFVAILVVHNFLTYLLASCVPSWPLEPLWTTFRFFVYLFLVSCLSLSYFKCVFTCPGFTPLGEASDGVDSELEYVASGDGRGVLHEEHRWSSDDDDSDDEEYGDDSRDGGGVGGGNSHSLVASAKGGRTRPRQERDGEDLEAGVALSSQRERRHHTTGGRRYCRKCHNVKADRVHHCSMCGRCVKRMDHHCPWVHNCVAFNNHKFFFLFLFHTFLTGVWSCATLFHQFLASFSRGGLGPGGYEPSVNIIITFFVGGMFALVLICFASFHLHLLCSNQTTLESMDGDGNKYDLGRIRNFKAVMGAKWWQWFLPITPPPEEVGNGTSYPRRMFEAQRDVAIAYFPPSSAQPFSDETSTVGNPSGNGIGINSVTASTRNRLTNGPSSPRSSLNNHPHEEEETQPLL